MGVILTVDRQKAILRDGEWRSADRSLETRLNEWTSSWILETGGPRLDASDPEMEVAKEMARRSNGRILLQSPSNARRSARVYFARRQYTFSF
jgi:hypothetical protein